MLFMSHAICAAQFAFHNLGAKVLQIFGIYKDFMKKIKFICNFFNCVRFFENLVCFQSPFVVLVRDVIDTERTIKSGMITAGILYRQTMIYPLKIVHQSYMVHRKSSLQRKIARQKAIFLLYLGGKLYMNYTIWCFSRYIS